MTCSARPFPRDNDGGPNARRRARDLTPARDRRSRGGRPFQPLAHQDHPMPTDFFDPAAIAPPPVRPFRLRDCRSLYPAMRRATRRAQSAEDAHAILFDLSYSADEIASFLDLAPVAFPHKATHRKDRT